MEMFSKFFSKKNFFLFKYSVILSFYNKKKFFNSIFYIKNNKKKSFIKTVNVKLFFLKSKLTFIFDIFYYKNDGKIRNVRLNFKLNIANDITSFLSILGSESYPKF